MKHRMNFSHCFVINYLEVLESKLFGQICSTFPTCKRLFSVYGRSQSFWPWICLWWLSRHYYCSILWFSSWRRRCFYNFDIINRLFIGLISLSKILFGWSPLVFSSLSLRLLFSLQIFLYFNFLLMHLS